MRIIALLLVVAAGCGGDDAGSPATTGSSSTGEGAGPVVASIEVPVKPRGVNADGELVWVASYSADELVASDHASNERRGPAVAVGDQPCGIVSGAGSLWVEIFGESRVDRVDPASREVVASIPVGLQAWDIAFGAGSVWCSNAGEGIVSRIDPATDEVVAIVAVAVRTQKRGRSLSERSTGRANLLRTSAGQHSSARGSLFSVGSFRFAALSRPP